MHVVYMVEFPNRVENKEYPCYYIGSKSNCSLHEGKIIDRHNKEYYGSSTSKEYHLLILTKCPVKITILYETDNYEDCLSKEHDFQIKHDVVADIKFFNKSIATTNNYSNPDFATFKHVDYPTEFRRLPRNHPLVLSGVWVGVTKNRLMSEDERKLRSMPGELNPFYGKKHSDESIQKAKDSYQTWLKDNPEYRDVLVKRASTTFKGKAKTQQQKIKMSNSAKGYVTLKNKETLETIRIKKDSIQYQSLIREEWTTTYALRERHQIVCDVCGKNGIDSSTFRRWHFKNCKKGNQNDYYED